MTTEPKFTYAVETETGDCITTAGRFAKGVRGIVRRSDGVAVWRSNLYLGDHAQRTARLQAGRQIGGYRYHLTKHGACFYDQQQAKQAERKAWLSERRDLITRLNSALHKGVQSVTGMRDDGGTYVAPNYEPGSPEAAIFEIAAEAARALPPRPFGA